jgi:F-type H+-transporting ATPase subunit epsilon
MSIDLTIVTPQGIVYQGPVEGVVLPGAEGEFGVLENHERFLSPLKTGEVEIKTQEGSTFAAIVQGFADVAGDEVTVLAESCEVAGEIDVARAELARERASQGLGQLDQDEDRGRFGEFEEALKRAENRLAVSSHSKG